jgi:ABC-2 type transport system ATP-binding protein
MSLAIEATGLRREFHSRTGWLRPQRASFTAVHGLDLSIPQGQLFGLLGPNGAGKTTTIKMLTTLLLPSSGSARVLGRDVVSDTTAVRARIGVVFGGDRGLYDRLSARDNLRYFAELYGVPPAAQPRRILELLEQVGLADRQKDRVEGFSRGMKQRLHIARGLLHDPPVVFLDEPTIGLDPVAARELRQTVAGLKEAGRTVLLTTHYMFEADELCDQIGIIDKGRLIALDTPAALKERASDRLIVDVLVRQLASETVVAVEALPSVLQCTVEPRGSADNLTVHVARGSDHDALRAHIEGLVGEADVLDFHPRRASLEDAYVAIVDAGKPAPEAVAAGADR